MLARADYIIGIFVSAHNYLFYTYIYLRININNKQKARHWGWCKMNPRMILHTHYINTLIVPWSYFIPVRFQCEQTVWFLTTNMCVVYSSMIVYVRFTRRARIESNIIAARCAECYRSFRRRRRRRLTRSQYIERLERVSDDHFPSMHIR